MQSLWTRCNVPSWFLTPSLLSWSVVQVSYMFYLYFWDTVMTHFSCETLLRWHWYPWSQQFLFPAHRFRCPWAWFTSLTHQHPHHLPHATCASHLTVVIVSYGVFLLPEILEAKLINSVKNRWFFRDLHYHYSALGPCCLQSAVHRGQGYHVQHCGQKHFLTDWPMSSGDL